MALDRGIVGRDTPSHPDLGVEANEAGTAAC